jgi:hypothetical protein
MEKTTKADDTLTDAVTIVISAVASFQDMLSESTLTAVRAAAEVEGGGLLLRAVKVEWMLCSQRWYTFYNQIRLVQSRQVWG